MIHAQLLECPHNQVIKFRCLVAYSQNHRDASTLPPVYHPPNFFGRPKSVPNWLSLPFPRIDLSPFVHSHCGGSRNAMLRLLPPVLESASLTNVSIAMEIPVAFLFNPTYFTRLLGKMKDDLHGSHVNCLEYKSYE